MENNGEWKVKQATFRGYMKSEIEHIKVELIEIKETNNRLDKKIECLNKFDKEMAFKVGALGFGGGGLAGLLILLIKTLIS